MLAELCLARRQYDAANDHARQALRIHQDLGLRLSEARSWRVLAAVAAATQGSDAATPHWQRAISIFAEVGSPEAAQLRETTGQP